MALDPLLQAFQDKVPILQVFGQGLCEEEFAADSNPIRARLIEGYIRQVAPAFFSVGFDNWC